MPTRRRRPARVHLGALARAAAWLLLLSLGGAARAGAEVPPPGLKVAFIGDQGHGADAVAVLQLIAAEGADAVVHAGDFDYLHDAAAWEARIDSVLGAEFPYLACIGNHDKSHYYQVGGYRERIAARMQRLGIAWSGDLGVQSTTSFRGLEIVMIAPGILGPGDGLYDRYLRDRFAASEAVWRLAVWHKNQHRMQAGGKSDETGWGVYEAARRAGAIIATGHEHSYSRTHLLSNMQLQTIASTGPLLLRGDDEPTPEDEGRSFAFVSGLGGQSIRDQEVFGDWFARVYTSTQGARPGALFGIFHVDADPRMARFYFKDVDGNVIDAFRVRSEVGVVDCPDADSDGVCDAADDCVATANPEQLDTDFDGYGDACDAGLGTDGSVPTDLHALWPSVGARRGRSGNGAPRDGGPPGGSGLACAGSVPCGAAR
jgi:predicted phosphodiesterase